MQEEPRAPQVSMLFADGDRGQRNAVRLYAKGQRTVKVSAAVSSGAELLALLEDGLRPDVLVIDSLIQRPNLYVLLRAVGEVSGLYHPAILVTCTALPRVTNEKLLTLGANCTILKPYTLPELFETVCHWGIDNESLAEYRARAGLLAQLAGMRGRGVPCGSLGEKYLVQIVLHRVLTDKDYTAEELYYYAADANGTDHRAVKSAIRRYGDALYEAGTSLYADLCRQAGKQPGERLTGKELIETLSERLRGCLRR